ncbi:MULTISPECIES: bifunctional diaminohydroxyphosphoribosylaminopyrimidine deaminase/5-amino-6-(5-phosphoribosylamino)uracil reductase RibD [unclassified Azospirillum]|uniref:bifunctional diaminohydroxyphosphoribosylaminopyrimidine deaminase/5-amino-6-(5-phosphoribosylamino)uracil reductase RibD n=1 Tax=unclassified Azospirillum TaxID=2630922 RepID=UPI000B670DA3|nr:MULTISPECIES: bifunctional diaminohydroxyphosphoribosylaminopyrimidine deaminase/5-amino-6-(5-phosphoribosylamino)uracil reductase RibD [unclassified Azospirillum]SNS77899.1 diaminohydroxyphosphoribosylaminopyrimidine deaminase / 5-amino-6-(5-phosphoribosylamino)uracil reductase [Azospirillum sp. RU38E]SNS95119.1 diaminohydroxyphosphoribosylaminopyrimidine deaminase / 5-amino-6-(5-phosphoribosylamino)uracil reductase [Azospirillum sp. RU37A]
MPASGFSPADHAHMASALALAETGLGRVWPNPSVGCLIVKDGQVLGQAVTAPGGRPHGETQALAQAGDAARGATAYVSLEPCNHHGKTPPCSEALIAAGVARVVVACEDPDPRVCGGGIRRLREAGIQVDAGLMAAEAEALNEGFINRIRYAKPMVSLKMATSLDGRIATRSGHSQWITGAPAREQGHRLRANHDAIMVGIGTALADDPELTCRLPGLEDRSPVRVVLDTRLRLPLTAKLVQQATRVSTWIVTLRHGAEAARTQAFIDCGVQLIEIEPETPGEIAIGTALRALAARGVTRVLAEGGSRLAASLLRAGEVDRLEWFRAPMVIGGDGLGAAAGFGIDDLADALRFRRVDVLPLGDDLLERYRRAVPRSR